MVRVLQDVTVSRAWLDYQISNIVEAFSVIAYLKASNRGAKYRRIFHLHPAALSFLIR